MGEEREGGVSGRGEEGRGEWEREGGVSGRGEGGRGEWEREGGMRGRGGGLHNILHLHIYCHFHPDPPSSPNKESLVIGERDASHSTDMPRQDRGAPYTDQGPSRQQQ